MNELNLDPSVSLLEQIDDQSLTVSGGTISTNWLLSNYLGNDGIFCTWSAECQTNGC